MQNNNVLFLKLGDKYTDTLFLLFRLRYRVSSMYIFAFKKSLQSKAKSTVNWHVGFYWGDEHVLKLVMLAIPLSKVP